MANTRGGIAEILLAMTENRGEQSDAPSHPPSHHHHTISRPTPIPPVTKQTVDTNNHQLKGIGGGPGSKKLF